MNELKREKESSLLWLQLQKEPEKNAGIETHDLCDCGEVLYNEKLLQL